MPKVKLLLRNILSSGVLNMGISSGSAEFLIECRRRFGVFNQTITLGALGFRTRRYGRLYSLMLKRGILDSKITLEDFRSSVPRGSVDPFLKMLGSTTIDSLDISDYQGAKLIHDLNKPLPQEYESKYDCVIDGGTLEHVFNIGEALVSVMRLLRPGGLFITLTMANNYCGHGFYQFSPELFYRTFSEENGFSVKLCKIYTEGKFVDIPDPVLIGKTGQMPPTEYVAMLMVGAHKLAHVQPFNYGWPAQGKFHSDWSSSEK